MHLDSICIVSNFQKITCTSYSNTSKCFGVPWWMHHWWKEVSFSFKLRHVGNHKCLKLWIIVYLLKLIVMEHWGFHHKCISVSFWISLLPWSQISVCFQLHTFSYAININAIPGLDRGLNYRLTLSWLEHKWIKCARHRLAPFLLTSVLLFPYFHFRTSVFFAGASGVVS